ncbi:uncharacterized protein LOC108113139 [Drosophila eugracilis]|uniref:uncharacterized protein LOC108113139 n=1 Tax=Drosophila eugracilis TaxID=29029 RepID=UPI0007E6D275|nr:uncharacterized protein LOC108113139 [Drosophila eugracilis]
MRYIIVLIIFGIACQRSFARIAQWKMPSEGIPPTPNILDSLEDNIKPTPYIGPGRMNSNFFKQKMISDFLCELTPNCDDLLRQIRQPSTKTELDESFLDSDESVGRFDYDFNDLPKIPQLENGPVPNSILPDQGTLNDPLISYDYPFIGKKQTDFNDIDLILQKPLGMGSENSLFESENTEYENQKKRFGDYLAQIYYEYNAMLEKVYKANDLKPVITL